MILLDTHAWWWSLTEPEYLSNKAMAMIRGAKTDDRIIVAASRIHNLTLLTKDQKILDYPYVKSTW